jgi:DNA-binding transcriptional LysR family regulator
MAPLMASRPDRWLGIELRHLTTLQTVAEEASFSRAASKLGYTQSAVSHQIAALERIVGVRLIDRPSGRNPVSLTEQGALLARHAQRILTTLSSAEAEMRRLIEGELTLRVGTFQSVGVKVMPAIMKHFAARFPHTAIELTEDVRERDLLRSVEGGDLDLTFATLPLEDGPFEYVELLTDPLVLLVPAGSELANRGPLTLQEVARIPLMSYRHCRKIAELRDIMRDHDLSPQFVCRSDDNSTIQAMVSGGIGAAVLPRLAIEPAHVGISVMELPLPVPPRVIVLVWRQDRSLSSATNYFLQVSRRVCAAHDHSHGALAVVRP